MFNSDSLRRQQMVMPKRVMSARKTQLWNERDGREKWSFESMKNQLQDMRETARRGRTSKAQKPIATWERWQGEVQLWEHENIATR